MISLPENATSGPIVIRTYFGDEPAWHAFCETIKAQFEDEPHFISDPTLASRTPQELLVEMPSGTTHNCVYVADEETLNNAETPVLVMDLVAEPGRTFRVIPEQVHAVQVNLWISNMDFEEFAHFVDFNGVFRGFPS